MSLTDTAPRSYASSVDDVLHAEGPVARSIEQQTAKLPSDTFLWAACAAMGISLALQASGKKHGGLFVGQWAAPLLVLGLYNKVVKVAGSDRVSNGL